MSITERISAEDLRAMRNEILIETLITRKLRIPHKYETGHLRFLCPECRYRHTDINRETNLARCFRCERNYNPIDLVMAELDYEFLTACAYLREFHD